MECEGKQVGLSIISIKGGRHMSNDKSKPVVAQEMHKQTTRRSEVPAPRPRRPQIFAKYMPIQSVQDKPVFERFHSW